MIHIPIPAVGVLGRWRSTTSLSSKPEQPHPYINYPGKPLSCPMCFPGRIEEVPPAKNEPFREKRQHRSHCQTACLVGSGGYPFWTSPQGVADTPLCAYRYPSRSQRTYLAKDMSGQDKSSPRLLRAESCNKCCEATISRSRASWGFGVSWAEWRYSGAARRVPPRARGVWTLRRDSEQQPDLPRPWLWRCRRGCPEIAETIWEATPPLFRQTEPSHRQVPILVLTA